MDEYCDPAKSLLPVATALVVRYESRMDVSRIGTHFHDAIEALLRGHRCKVFSIVTIDAKQKRGYAPVTAGLDCLQCHLV